MRDFPEIGGGDASGGDGHDGLDTQARDAIAPKIPRKRAARKASVPTLPITGVPSEPNPSGSNAGGEVRATDFVSPTTGLPDLAETIQVIRDLQIQRVHLIKQQIRQTNATGALIRRFCGWSPNLPEKERAAVNKRAARIIDAVENGEILDSEDGQIAASLGPIILTDAQMREPLDKMRLNIEKRMAKAVKALPVYPWAEAVRGFGALGLAIIVGEALDLSRYGNPAKLWKRMGLGMVSDRRQGNPGTDASADDWIAHAYNKRRRSSVWVLGDSLLKGNRDGEYRALYLTRKAYEHERALEMSKMHAHRRAQRYMEKRLLRDLWRAWRAAAGIAECAA